MISTLNGCYHSTIKVIPKNWHTTKASVKTPWRIYYQFHDPAILDNCKNLIVEVQRYRGSKEVPTRRHRGVTDQVEKKRMFRIKSNSWGI
ncbi:hypothetical protein, partial [Niastella yeongjuensis]|uniref:hypothetical protein n=1 Tax=Niastella yeongjuensis TaxID=354355 RepID=UPI001A99FAE4